MRFEQIYQQREGRERRRKGWGAEGREQEETGEEGKETEGEGEKWDG